MQLNAPHRNATSMINREQLAKTIEESRKQAQAAETAATAPAEPALPPMVEAPKTEEEKKEKSRYEEFLAYKKDVEAELEMELTDDDVRDLIFKTRLAKEMSVCPGFLRGVFRTLTTDEVGEVDKQMSVFAKDNPDLLPQAAANERAKTFLSWAWLSAGVEGDVRSLGDNPPARRDAINKMSATVVEEAAKTWSTFDTYVRLTLRSRTLLKKS